MTKCYDGKNAKTNACGSGIQAPSCCYAYAFSQFGQKLYELAFKSFYSSSSLLKMFFFSISTSDSYLPSIFGSNPRKQYFCSLNTFGTLSLNKEFAEIQYLSFLLECPLNSRPQKPRCELFWKQTFSKDWWKLWIGGVAKKPNVFSSGEGHCQTFWK